MAIINYREFKRKDVPQVLELMKGLAKFEGYIDNFNVTESDLISYGLGKNPRFKIFVACKTEVIFGIAVTYTIPWTYDLRPTVILKELYISKQARGKGIGKSLMKKVANYAKLIDAPRIQWTVLENNEKAKTFYQSLGATTDKNWLAYALNEQSIKQLV